MKLLYYANEKIHIDNLVPIYRKTKGTFIVGDPYKDQNVIGYAKKELKSNFLALSGFNTRDFNRILDKFKPDGVIVSQASSPTYRALLLAAKHKGIKTFLVPESFWSETKNTLLGSIRYTLTYRHKVIESYKYFISTFVSAYGVGSLIGRFISKAAGLVTKKSKTTQLENVDYVFAGNDYARQNFVKSGFPSENIFVTGTPRFEQLSKHNPKGGKYVLFISQPLVEDGIMTEKQKVDLINRTISENQDDEVVIKPHYREGKEFFGKYFPHLKLLDGNLEKIILGAKVVYGYNSMALYEAELLGKKVIFLGSSLPSISQGNHKASSIKIINQLHSLFLKHI